MTRRVAVVTGSRADYGLLQWILRDLATDPAIELQLCVTGAHLSPMFGRTIDAIHADGFAIAAEVPSLQEGDDQVAIARSIAQGIAGMADAFARLRPDVVLLMADRYEIFAAASAAVALGVPIAHLSGGEATEGLFDDQLRHAITKLSRIHFASMPFYRDRIIRMGELPDRVFAVGEPGLDHCLRTPLMNADEASSAIGLDLRQPTAVVTYHPVTLEPERADGDLAQFIAALEELQGLQFVVSHPGADPGALAVRSALEAFVSRRRNAVMHRNLGTVRYLSLLRLASVMIGNSSSGIVEAPSFELPVVNVGSRQRGRIRAANVLDVDPTAPAITAAVRRAVDSSFRASLRGIENPYGDGRTAERVVRILKGCDLQALRYKPFYDGPFPA